MGNTTSIEQKMNGNSLLKCFAILVLSNLARSEDDHGFIEDYKITEDMSDDGFDYSNDDQAQVRVQVQNTIICTIICEHSKQTLKCPVNQIISITSAAYGRTNYKTCKYFNEYHKVPSGGCSARGAQKKIETLCNGKQSCIIYASNSIFGDPCIGTYKYANVSWSCVDKKEKCDPVWTKFYNRDRPSGTGDWETLKNLRAENPGEICANPIAVEARLADGRPAAASGNKITISPLGGLVCQNCYQPKNVKKCNDFKIRFLCLK